MSIARCASMRATAALPAERWRLSIIAAGASGTWSGCATGASGSVCRFSASWATGRSTGRVSRIPQRPRDFLCLWSGARRRDAKPVAVRVYEVALAPGEPIFVHGYPELLGHGIDVLDIEVDQRVRPSVALVLRQVDPHSPACHGHEPGEAGLELMLPLLGEPEPRVPRGGPRRVVDVENGHDRLVHVPEGNASGPRARPWRAVLTGNRGPQRPFLRTARG